MSTPRISILLATRNRSRLLRQALASVQNQTLRDIEILVLDDGSEDDTPKVLAEAAHQDGRVKVFRHETGQGLSAALNRLLENAQGELVARMDDDDTCHPARLERQYKFMNEHDFDLCGTWYCRQGRLRNYLVAPPEADEAIKAELLFQAVFAHPSILMYRNLFERHGGYSMDYPYAEDYELWTRLAPFARMGNLPIPLYDFGMQPGRVSQTFNAVQVESARKIRRRYLESFNFPVTAEEMDLHVSIRTQVPIESLDELMNMENWLRRLAERFPGGILATRMIAAQWLHVCIRAAGLGPTVWHGFLASPLLSLAEVSPRRRTVLKLLCHARVRYRSRLFNALEQFSPG